MVLNRTSLTLNCKKLLRDLATQDLFLGLGAAPECVLFFSRLSPPQCVALRGQKEDLI